MTPRALLFNIVFYLNLLVLLLAGLPLLVMPRRVAMKGLKLWGGSTMFWQRLIVGTGVELRGLDNLRIIDASVFPDIVGGNINACTMMVAEKGTHYILAT